MVIQIDSNLAQQIVDTVKRVCGHDINFIDASGFIIASTDAGRIGSYHEIGHQVAKTRKPISVVEGGSFTGTRQGINLPVVNDHTLLAVIGISGDPERVAQYADLAVRVTMLLVRERELMYLSHTRADKEKFILDTLLQNPKQPPELLFQLISELKLDLNQSCRIVFLRMSNGNAGSGMAIPVVEELFEALRIPLRSYRYPNEYLAALEDERYPESLDILGTFAKDQGSRFRIAVGQACPMAKLSISYETAKIAWESLGSGEKNLALFDDMTLELVLASVKPDVRRIFQKRLLQTLSAKECNILRCYFENDMSLAAASEQLYMHKNTLQYQLNHIFAQCGRNPRRFQDAVQLYLALQIME